MNMRDRIMTCLLLLVLCGPARHVGAEPARQERVEVTLVLIDVVVRDRRDRPVSGLRREDFRLRVDRQTVTREEVGSFEEICTPEAREPGTETSPSPGHIAIYLDFSQLSYTGRFMALGAARRFVEERLAPEERVMIQASMGGDEYFHHPFTTDRARLLEGLDSLKEDAGTVSEEILEEDDRIAAVTSGPPEDRLRMAHAFAMDEADRARRTIRSLERFLPRLGRAPGRKALVLLTDRWRREPGVQYLSAIDRTPGSFGINIDGHLDRLAALANALSISFYTAQAAGFQDGTEDAFGMPGRVALRMKAAAETGLRSAIDLQRTLAERTGGRALYNRNNVGSILDSASRDLSCYYIIGCRFEARHDGSHHAIAVRLASKGKHLRGARIRHRPYFVDR